MRCDEFDTQRSNLVKEINHHLLRKTVLVEAESDAYSAIPIRLAFGKVSNLSHFPIAENIIVPFERTP